MNDQKLTNELLELERRYWQALRDRDAETALSLTDNPCIVTGAQGVASLDHEHMRRMIDSAQWDLRDFQLSDDAQVRKLSDDVAILAYNVHENLTVDGQPISLDAADASTWVRRNGQWKCALHTESIAGDPFGRDRANARTASQESAR